MKRYCLLICAITCLLAATYSNETDYCKLSYKRDTIRPATSTLASFEVTLAHPLNGVAAPAFLNLDELTFLSDSALSLVETVNNQTRPVPFQIKNNANRTLYWQIPAGDQKKHQYRLINTMAPSFPVIDLKNADGQLTFHSGEHNLLNYYFKTLYPPAGIDTNFKRSGFIHPLWTPHGQELTRIQAPDHYHHYGIWNPWTHVYFEGDTVDFWNLKEKQGTVRFAKLVSVTEGPVFSEFEALHEHVVFKKDGTEKVALNELQTVRVYKPGNRQSVPQGGSSTENNDYFIVDITSQMNCASESPFLIVAYRYAGMGWRTTGFWDNNNCEVLTSEGKNRDNTDGSKAKWCIVQGALPGNDSGGVAFLSYPANYNHPEPMRIWVKNTNKRGDMFFSFAPTKDRNWLLQPGKTYVLQYRLVVFNGKFDAAKAESAWNYFAHPPVVQIKK
jgi:hypothetical protein